MVGGSWNLEDRQLSTGATLRASSTVGAHLKTDPEVDRPPREAIEKAAHFLCRIGALDTRDAGAFDGGGFRV